MLALLCLVTLASAAVIPSAVFRVEAPSAAPVQVRTTTTIQTTNLTTTPELNCPFDIKGHFEFPHLIIPTNKEDPQQAPGTAYWAEMTSKVSLKIRLLRALSHIHF